VCVGSTSIGGGFAAPRIRNVEHSGLVAISGRSPKLLLCILIWCCCISAAVYLPLCICRCVYCVLYPLLYLLLFIYHCVSTAVYLPPYIRRCVYRAMYLELLLYIRRCEYVSWPGTVYLAVYLSLYIYLPWCICHCVCFVVYPLLYLPLCTRCCLSDAAIHGYLSDTGIRCCVSASVYTPVWICCCLSVTVYQPLYIYLLLYILHCISATVSAVLLSVIEYKERDWIIYRTKAIIYRTI